MAENDQPMRAPARSPHLDALLMQLDRPLDDPLWQERATPSARLSSGGLFQRLRSDQRNLADLERARAAAARAFGVKPCHKARADAEALFGTPRQQGMASLA